MLLDLGFANQVDVVNQYAAVMGDVPPAVEILRRLG
jgi:hypothetical protein